MGVTFTDLYSVRTHQDCNEHLKTSNRLGGTPPSVTHITVDITIGPHYAPDDENNAAGILTTDGGKEHVQ
jgi:hypothetical protein